MRTVASRIALSAAAALCVLAFAPDARAGAIIDRAAQSLQSDPVYVDPQAKPTISAAEERRLENEIARAGGGPIYVAVLPGAARGEAGGDAGEALRVLATEVGRRGAYAIVAGGQFRAGATRDTGLEQGESKKLATHAFEAHRGDLDAALVDFVDRVGEARADADAGGGGGAGRLFPLLLVGGAGALGFVWLKRRRAASNELTEVKEAARQDLVALADDVAGLEDDVERDPAAKRDYLAALEQYDDASRAFDRAQTPQALEPVAKALEEGRWLMASAEARLEGRPLPERRPPCFFDPRHGPSVRDVPWAPYGGTPREVPACAADALRVEEGVEPESRQVMAGGRMVPYWSAPGYFGGYFGGFLPGLLVGELMGGFWGGGVGGGSGDYGGGYRDGGGADGGFGGELGGGDVGGDFGGGGGDFGGGDFGGGGGDF